MSCVWGLVLFRLVVSNCNVWGLDFSGLGVSFLSFGG